jgi:hypothetical protein
MGDKYPKLDWSDLDMGIEDLLRQILEEVRELREVVDKKVLADAGFSVHNSLD